MATTRTLTDLATSVMRDLGLIDGAEEPSAIDRKYIVDQYTEALEELRDDGLVYWQADAIPLEVFPAITAYMALIVGPTFGRRAPGDQDAALESAKKRLRRRVARKSTGEQTEFSSY